MIVGGEGEGIGDWGGCVEEWKVAAGSRREMKDNWLERGKNRARIELSDSSYFEILYFYASCNESYTVLTNTSNSTTEWSLSHSLLILFNAENGLVSAGSSSSVSAGYIIEFMLEDLEAVPADYVPADLIYRRDYWNSPKRLGKDAKGNTIVHPPVSLDKHIEIRHHFIRDANEKNLIQVLKIHTDDNVADLLTKAFDGPRFEYLVVHIGMYYGSAGHTSAVDSFLLNFGCVVPAVCHGFAVGLETLEGCEYVVSIVHVLIDEWKTVVLFVDMGSILFRVANTAEYVVCHRLTVPPSYVASSWFRCLGISIELVQAGLMA
ncbi:hypothetical protein Tco_0911731 [Tanacetum coccineum]|uniref:Uncharacterized protein n=1 Tax=Tanacetum coccineum TaxID=301880 RepID=A0ABQ5CZX3_9ASTR